MEHYAGIDLETRHVRDAFGTMPVKTSQTKTNIFVGFLRPEYLFDSKEIIRAGLEDHFRGKLLGVPMGCDVCCTNHADTQCVMRRQRGRARHGPRHC